ncbi:hypothetical protein BDR26DRAFT_662947 [Obelidium mucronatum]|nr:hypothetical protein BDR26DRAFT_662947 [Obelidium mucronatum]
MKVILTIKSGQFNAVRSWFGAGSPEQATIRVLNAFNMQTKCKDVADSSVAWDESFEFVSLQSHVTLAILSKADGFPIATTVVRFMPLEEQQPYTVTFFQGSNMYFRLFVEIQVINVTPSISDYGVDLILESLGLITNCAQALVEMAKETDKSPDLKAEMSPSENTLGSILGSSDSETGTDSDIAENLEGLVDVKLLADLVAQSRDFITKFTGNQSSTTLIEDLTRSDTTLSNINVDLYIPQSSTSNSIGGADAGQAGILDVLGDIANCHPILKLTWFIISAGYKMATRAKQEQEKLQELSEKFIAASKEIDRLKSIKISGIPVSVRDILRDSMNLYVLCLKNVLKILSKHLSSQAKNMVSSLFGSNLDEINSVLESLDVAKSHLANTKRDGTFFLALETVQKLESMARQVDDVAKDVKSIKAAISIVSRSSTDIASRFFT